MLLFEYIELIQSLFQKGFEVYVVPTTTTKIKNPSPNERFSEEKITMGTVEYTGDASENRNAVETKLTSLIFPLSHYLGYKKVYVLGFDTNKERIKNLKKGFDITNEFTKSKLKLKWFVDEEVLEIFC